MNPPYCDTHVSARHTSESTHIWQTLMGMIDASPALVAASPQASPFVDDFHHNGALRPVAAAAPVHAYDKKSGDLLWELELPAGVFANPLT